MLELLFLKKSKSSEKSGGKKNTAYKVQQFVEPLILENTLILWDVRFEKDGSCWFLRVMIDKKDGLVNFEDCEKISRPLDKLLDDADFIEQSYFLEVSSAGLNRELKKSSHFEYSKGKKVLIKTIRPVEGVRDFLGILEKVEDDIVYIKQENEIIFSHCIKDCSYIKLAEIIPMEEINYE